MRDNKHAFSIEMHSKQYVRQIIVTNDAHNKVLFEGFLGDLQAITLIDGEMLEIQGSYGTLRLDVLAKDLRTLIHLDNIRSEAYGDGGNSMGTSQYNVRDPNSRHGGGPSSHQVSPHHPIRQQRLAKKSVADANESARDDIRDGR